jgi:hypothetical protein
VVGDLDRQLCFVVDGWPALPQLGVEGDVADEGLAGV